MKNKYIPSNFLERLHRCRPLVIIGNFFYLFVILWYLFQSFLEWLWFYLKLFYYKASKPLWRV